MSFQLSALSSLLIIGCGDVAEPLAQTCGPASAQVVRVIDGDTIELDSGDKIRLLLIDAPELSRKADVDGDCFSDEAKELTEILVGGQEVKLQYEDGKPCTDHFGRLLAYVWVGDAMVNQVMVERGYARVMVVKPHDRYAEELKALEAAAQEHHAGLWGLCE